MFRQGAAVPRIGSNPMQRRDPGDQAVNSRWKEQALNAICGVAFLLALTPFVAFFAIRWGLGLDR
jgi:hypothetical protein